MLQAQHWERPLLDLAHQALDSGENVDAHLGDDTSLMVSAYDYCSEITRENSKTFYIASSLLPEKKRRASRALYAFCRISDDIVDRPGESESAFKLAQWRSEVTLGSQGFHNHSGNWYQLPGQMHAVHIIFRTVM